MYKVVKDVIAKKRKFVMCYDEHEFNQTVGQTKNHGILKNKPEGKEGFGSKGSVSFNEKERSIKDGLIFRNLVHPLGPTKNVFTQVPNAPKRWEEQAGSKDAATQVSNAPEWWDEIHHLILKQLKDLHFEKEDSKELGHNEHCHEECENDDIDSYTNLAGAFEEGNEEKQNILMDKILDVSVVHKDQL